VARCSIVVPVFNLERFVAEAVGSALAQTATDIQVVVVNDGSTDGTAAALDPFRGRITYVEQDNKGLAAARNRGIAEADGNFIALLDADDVYLPTRVERLLAHLDDHPEIGFATSDAHLLRNGNPSSSRYYEGGTFPHAEQARAIFDDNFIFGSAVIRRELLDRHGAFDERLRSCEDWDLWMRFIWSGERAGFIDEPLMSYRLRSDSLSHTVGSHQQDRLLVALAALERPEAASIPGLGPLVVRKARDASGLGEWELASRFWRHLATRHDFHAGGRLKARLAAEAPRLISRLDYYRYGVRRSIKSALQAARGPLSSLGRRR
jgi:glycosyltransferase involved in cell wall biosynthesis